MSLLKWFSVFFFCSLGLNAQDLEPKIAQDSVVQRMAEQRILINRENYNKLYFTIQLYNGGYKQAKEIQKQATELFPDLPLYFTFETPNYKVQLGRFKFKSKATQELERIKKKFAESFLIQQQ